MLWRLLLTGLYLFLPALTLAQPYSGPPTASTEYWEVPAFSDLPYKGPEKATGAMFWSHGLAGNLPQWQGPPPDIIRDFARAGWDVVKVQRNHLYETGWERSGVNHVSDVVARIAKARSAGYKRIIAAGQSYGGVISLEAAIKSDQIDGVLAMTPGYGSESCSPGNSAIFRRSDMAGAWLRQGLEKVKVPRFVLMLAADDECKGFGSVHPEIRQGLTASRIDHFIFLDDRMPVHGHGAGYTAQFRTWYGSCILDFLNFEKGPAGRAIECAAPAGVTRFLLPSGYPAERLRDTGGGALTGAWSGALKSDPPEGNWGRLVCIVVETVSADRAAALIAYGSGPRATLGMSAAKRSLRRDGESWTYRGDHEFSLSLRPAAGNAAGTLSLVSAGGDVRWTAEMTRGCPTD